MVDGRIRSSRPVGLRVSIPLLDMASSLSWVLSTGQLKAVDVARASKKMKEKKTS